MPTHRSAATLTEFAPAKVNLTLRVLGRRADGYHDIESLVVFADVGDRLTFAAGERLELVVRGPSAGATGPLTDNLVLKAARALSARVEGLSPGRFVLDKELPIAAGLGGGSADAAAALRLLAPPHGLASDDPRMRDSARAVGADVPVCLDPRSRVMLGIGDILSGPMSLPKLPAVLINPGVALSTRDVFACLAPPARVDCPTTLISDVPLNDATLLAALAERGNDLEAPAIALQPVIADVLASLRAAVGCRLARMSGSGATCFGLFDSMRAAEAAGRNLAAAHGAWWLRAVALG